MNKAKSTLRMIAELVIMGALIVGLGLGIQALLRQASPREAGEGQVAGQPYPPPSAAPTSTPEGYVRLTPTRIVVWPGQFRDTSSGTPYPPPAPPPTSIWTQEPEPVEPPTETMVPAPTRPPTPVVTPIPVAEPPFVSAQPEHSPEPYDVIFRDGNTLRIIDQDGKNERLLLDVGVYDGLYLAGKYAGGTWISPSPDGEKLAIVLGNVAEVDDLTRGEALKVGLYLFEVKTNTLELLVEDGLEPSWSPDGSLLAYRNWFTGSLWIVNLATREMKERFSVAQAGMATLIDWSPDSRRLAFVNAPSTMGAIGEVWVADVAGNAPATQLTPIEMYAGCLDWAPSGNLILFFSQFADYLSAISPTNLWIVDPDTGLRRQLSYDFGISPCFAEWSPDSAWIVFQARNYLEGKNNPGDIWLIASDGGELKRLTADQTNNMAPSWVSSTRIVYLREGMGIWEMDLTDGAVRQVSPQEIGFGYFVSQ
jgi:hypothetical protein